jgi:hypothetical protein
MKKSDMNHHRDHNQLQLVNSCPLTVVQFEHEDSIIFKEDGNHHDQYCYLNDNGHVYTKKGEHKDKNKDKTKEIIDNMKENNYMKTNHQLSIMTSTASSLSASFHLYQQQFGNDPNQTLQVPSSTIQDKDEDTHTNIVH